MVTSSQTLERINLASPEDIRSFPNGKVEVVSIGGTTIGRATFEPGWKWSECVKPIAKTDSCEAAHLGYCVSGRMTVVMDDGSRTEVGPGDAYSIPPGHDAWIEGNQPFVGLDFVGFKDYAKQ